MEDGNQVDVFAVAVVKEEITVGHIPIHLLFVPTSRRVDCLLCNGS